MLVETALNKYSTLVENLLPILQKRSKGSYIGLAILAIILQQSYSFLNPPKKLSQFPKVSFLSIAKSFYTNESVVNRFKRLVLPLVQANHGFYVVSSTLS